MSLLRSWKQFYFTNIYEYVAPTELKTILFYKHLRICRSYGAENNLFYKHLRICRSYGAENNLFDEHLRICRSYGAENNLFYNPLRIFSTNISLLRSWKQFFKHRYEYSLRIFCSYGAENNLFYNPLRISLMQLSSNNFYSLHIIFQLETFNLLVSASSIGAIYQ